MPAFRERLLATLRAVEPVLAIPGVLVAGSQLPNLMEPGAASTLVVSQDVDVLVPVELHAQVRDRLAALTDLVPSPEEPSVWVPRPGDGLRIEVNFIGKDASIVDPIDTYELEDERLPLMVFGPLSLLEAGPVVEIDGLRIPLPRPAGATLEKLVTDRTGEKGDRDLLVVAGLLASMSSAERRELATLHARLPPDLRHAARANLAVLSLLPGRPGMPDPVTARALVDELLARLEAA